MRFLIILVLFSSCMTTQKAKNFLEKNGDLDSICMEEFKPVDSIVIKDSVSFDTLYLETLSSDTVEINDTVYITKTVPKVITKTVSHTKEVFTENTARVKYLESVIEKANKYTIHLEDRNILLQESESEWKKKARKRNLLLIIII